MFKFHNKNNLITPPKKLTKIYRKLSKSNDKLKCNKRKIIVQVQCYRKEKGHWIVVANAFNPGTSMEETGGSVS